MKCVKERKRGVKSAYQFFISVWECNGHAIYDRQMSLTNIGSGEIKPQIIQQMGGDIQQVYM